MDVAWRLTKGLRCDFTLISSQMLAGSHVVRLLRMIRISRLVCPGMCLHTETHTAEWHWIVLQKPIYNINTAEPTWGSGWPGWESCTGTALLHTLCPQLSSEQQCASLDFLVVKQNITSWCDILLCCNNFYSSSQNDGYEPSNTGTVTRSNCTLSQFTIICLIDCLIDWLIYWMIQTMITCPCGLKR